jgi:microcystin-dependent protein
MMADPFIAEVKIISWNYAPKGWAFCNGQLLPINQNQALFSLLGTTYGGNGQTNFALPDLRGRAPIHQGAGQTEGQRVGQETHTLLQSEMPAHNHVAQGSSTNADQTDPTSNILAASNTPMYHSRTNATTLHPATVTNVGGGQPHDNMQPYLVLNFIIALVGIFPPHN